MVTSTKIKKIKESSASTNADHTALAKADNLPISTKQSIEICNFLRYKDLQKAKKILSNVIVKKTAIPYLRFNMDTGHKPGIAAGRYPNKASKEILKLLNSAEANAENKGLDASNLIISKMIANKGNRMHHPGRHRGIKMKRTHIEVQLEEKQITST
ncbi:50S ribosomal protein L22 [Candidatus Woesearchaeota archaeon]|nr:50S ribosomal protein L22 [Candidatus Woesearchaeota archaeon]